MKEGCSAAVHLLVVWLPRGSLRLLRLLLPGSRETLERKVSLSLALTNLWRHVGLRSGFGTAWRSLRLQSLGVRLWCAPSQHATPAWSSQEGLFRVQTLKGWEGLMCWAVDTFRTGPSANGQKKTIQMMNARLLCRAGHTVTATQEVGRLGYSKVLLVAVFQFVSITPLLEWRRQAI